MQKNERVAARFPRPGIHLQRAPARRRDHPVAKRARELRRAVGAAAVHHDDLVAAPAQRLEHLQSRSDAPRLVQRRDDDGKSDQPRIHACSLSTCRSSASGACAFLHTPAAYLFASASVG